MTQTTKRAEIDNSTSHSTTIFHIAFVEFVSGRAKNFFHVRKAKNGGENIARIQIAVKRNIHEDASREVSPNKSVRLGRQPLQRKTGKRGGSYADSATRIFSLRAALSSGIGSPSLRRPS